MPFVNKKLFIDVIDEEYTHTGIFTIGDLDVRFDAVTSLCDSEYRTSAIFYCSFSRELTEAGKKLVGSKIKKVTVDTDCSFRFPTLDKEQPTMESSLAVFKTTVHKLSLKLEEMVNELGKN